MKKILLALLFSTILFTPFTQAEWIDNVEIQKETSIPFWDTFKVDISDKINDFQETLWNEDLIFEWDVKRRSTIQGPLLEIKFEESGIKDVRLNIFSQQWWQKTLLKDYQFEVFVYRKSIPFLFSTSIPQAQKDDFINLWRNSGIYIYDVLTSSEQNLYGENILQKLNKYWSTEKGKADFIGVWGEKEFLFSVISKLNKEQENSENQKSINFLLISPFNGNILQGYLWNLITNKDYISETIIIDDTLNLQITKSPEKISQLRTQLTSNGYNFIDVNTKEGISKYFFLSRFINTLSNSGINTTDIFILIMIPFILTMISFMKHFIGISPIGITIPLFLSILFYKIGIPFTFWMIVLLFSINFFISRWTNKYNLLYTPKISFLTTINIVCFFLALELWLRYDLFVLELTDIVYVIFFIVIAERIITIVVAKEFREYRRNLWGTILIWFFWFLLLQIPFFQVFILAYPEIIILLIPINFMIGRFTGLRVTEYLRFKEIIKNIEEE